MSAQKQLPDLAIGAKILRLAEGLSEAGLRYIVERLQTELELCRRGTPPMPLRRTSVLESEINSALKE